MSERNKLFVFLISLIVLIIIFTLTMLSYFFIGYDSQNYLVSIFVKYHFLFMLVSNILALIFGFISYLFLAKNFDINKEKEKKYLNNILNILEKEEKNIIEYLIKNNGVATQYELVKISKTNKVKVHRIIEKLEKKGVIEKQKIGKINKIYLSSIYL